MSAIDETMVRWALEMLLGLSCLTVLLVTLSLLVRTRMPRREAGNFCGHCGETLPKEISRGIAFADSTYNVYTCRYCKRETILPSP